MSFNGRCWVLTFGLELKNEVDIPTDNVIGIDLGIKYLAVCSDGVVYKNINKDASVKKLEKRLKRLQRQVSRKYELNKKGGNRYIKTNNIKKLEKDIKNIHRRLKNIRLNHLHQTTADIVKTKPYRIVIEDLNVKGMMRNKHLSKAVAQQKFNEFRNKLANKCNALGIELRIVDRFYPSSKLCHKCGSIKKDLKLKDRIFNCDCGYVEDRDYNASLNLRDAKIYKIA